MTGYAVSSCDSASGTLTIEIKSVNSRFLDLQFRINDDLRALEPALREAIVAKISRGKVECRVSFGRKVADGNSLALNQTMLEQLHKLQVKVAQTFADAKPLSCGEILRWPGIIEEAQISQESLAQDANKTLATSLQAFIDSRAREGAALEAMLLSRIEAMEAIVHKVAPIIPAIIAQFQQKAMDRMQEALGVNNDGHSLSRQEALERIRQEVTLYGIRIDLAEELSRLSAHLSETRAILKKGGQVGKRLDFMMQELNREANTLGSKAAVKELADASMELKLLIEQMREQVQNLE
ncbi:MAG: YicC family protein [Burkholderiales bacterium]|nr:YicC family protein [Burkholderiales bacterium]